MKQSVLHKRRSDTKIFLSTDIDFILARGVEMWWATNYDKNSDCFISTRSLLHANAIHSAGFFSFLLFYALILQIFFIDNENFAHGQMWQNIEYIEFHCYALLICETSTRVIYISTWITISFNQPDQLFDGTFASEHGAWIVFAIIDAHVWETLPNPKHHSAMLRQCNKLSLR